MMRARLSLFALASSFSLVACRKSVSLKDYTDYLNDPAHGLVQATTTQGLDLVCAFKPTSLFAYQDAAAGGATGGPPAAAGTDPTSPYKDNVYVTLSFAKDGQEVENAFLRDEPLHSVCLSYLTHYVYEDVTLCTATDTIPAAASTYSRQYGTTRASTVLVVFARGRADLSRGFAILYRGTRFNLGPLRFSFTADALRNLPTLRY